jgi:hypothetical protein
VFVVSAGRPLLVRVYIQRREDNPTGGISLVKRSI